LRRIHQIERKGREDHTTVPHRPYHSEGLTGLHTPAEKFYSNRRKTKEREEKQKMRTNFFQEHKQPRAEMQDYTREEKERDMEIPMFKDFNHNSETYNWWSYMTTGAPPPQSKSRRAR
jgi:hypothetical protein